MYNSLEALLQLAAATQSALPRARAPAVAGLEAARVACSHSSNTEATRKLLAASNAFFERFSDQTRCAPELQNCLRNISATERHEFRDHVGSFLAKKASTTMKPVSRSKIGGDSQKLTT